MLTYIAIALATAAIMEFVAWFAHKYIMHGPLWSWHEDHHKPHTVISIYGMIYFLIHDVYIHRRFKWFKQLDSKYSRAILRAHGTHHAVQTKENCESFGLLVVDNKFFKKRSRKKEEADAEDNNKIYK